MMIILMGAPGVGKGTQAKVLCAKLKLRHISTGESLRQAIKENTSLGSQVRQYVESGRLVPDQLITRMVIERLSRNDLKSGCILDGFPRNTQQARDLDKFLSAKITSAYMVIYLDASEKTLIQRLSGRRLCKKCQAVFHLVNMPPKKDMRCDFCGAELYQRPDDKEETIKNRLRIYQEQTAPVIDYYAKQNRLLHIDANRELKPVLKECLKLLKGRGNHIRLPKSDLSPARAGAGSRKICLKFCPLPPNGGVPPTAAKGIFFLKERDDFYKVRL